MPPPAMPYPPPDAYDRGQFTFIPAQAPETPPERPWYRTVGRWGMYGLGAAGLAWGLRRPLDWSTQYLDIGVRPLGSLTWRQLVGGQLQVRDIVLNAIKAAEELSPFYLGRTFGLTELLSPYVLGRRPTLYLPYNIVQEQLPYLEALVSRPGFQLHEAHWAGGMLVQGGKLFGITAAGEQIELLPYARLRLSYWQPPRMPDVAHPPLRGRLSAATQEILARSRGIPRTLLIPAHHEFPFHVVGTARPWRGIPWRFYVREIQSLAELWNRRFFRLLDNPLELLADLGMQLEGVPGVETLGRLLGHTGLTYRFGLAGDYSGNIARQWLRWILPGFAQRGPYAGRFRPGALLTFVGLPFLFRAADQYLRDRGEIFEGTALQYGLSGAVANAWQRLMLARARFGQATGLSAWARLQEQYAPASTNPATLLGLPLALGIMGGLVAFGQTRFRLSSSALATWRRIKLPQHQFGPLFGRLFPGRYTLTGKYVRAAMAVGTLLEAPFLPGMVARVLGGLQTPEELEAIYSGQEEVPVRRGRWWEFGSSFYRGERVQYFRPHWTVLAKSDYLDKSLFRGDESWLFKAAKRTPILTDIVAPYYLERLHYYDRPYPITGPSIPPLGPIGPLYAMTVGRLFKPVRYMHREAWEVPGGYRYQPEEHAPIPELGGLPPAPPEDPYSLKNLGAEAFHRWTEAIGLPGWLLRESLGSDEWGARGLQFLSAERLTSGERAYWDRQLGGLMGMTEWYRRVNNRRRTALAQQEYAPIPNTMPSWLPGENYFINFHLGDLTRLPEMEARLPGPGYAALYPEVQGVHPEDYPDIHRLRILTNVAPWADETRQLHELMAQRHKSRQLSAEEAQAYLRIRQQWQTLKKRRTFHEYRDWREEPTATRALGRYWEFLAHGGERLLAGESLLPLRPMAKFVHQRDPIEDYVLAQFTGADQGFWNRPVEHFLEPAAERLGYNLGRRRESGDLAQRRRIEEYFDKLRFLRARLHTRRALEQGDHETARLWAEEAARTVTGVVPTLSREGIQAVMQALPRRERDYFPYFLEEEDPRRQSTILQLVPQNVGRLYRLLWSQRALQRLQHETVGTAAETTRQEVEQLTKALQLDIATGGRFTPQTLREYQEEQPGEPPDEWLLRRELEEFFTAEGLPPLDSIVWDPRVDLEDVKLRVVQSQALDYHDFDLWEARARTLVRKPYLQGVEEELDDVRSPAEVQRQVQQLLRDADIRPLELDVMPGTGTTRLEVVHDNTKELSEILRQRTHGKRRPLTRRHPIRSKET